MTIMNRPTRRFALGTLIGGGALALSAPFSRAAAPKANPATDTLNEDAVLRDPALPVGGNPNGDISLVEWFDYQCPYCRKLATDLRSIVAADGKLRMIHKDWPILGPESAYAAKLALAARFQNKYAAAHEALIAGTGRLTEQVVRDRLAAGGIDVDKALADMVAKKDDIEAVLARNDTQARAFDFEATPSFIIGKFRVPATLTPDQFVLAIADARKALKAKTKPTRKI